MENTSVKDSRFKVKTLASTLNPQTLVYAALHQDYSEEYIWKDLGSLPSEKRCGEVAIKRLLSGGRGHYGCFEHPVITFTCGYFPHSVIQQARTHRVGVTFDVQSLRYTSLRFLEVARGERDVEDVFYLRPVGNYSDRSGKKYSYTQEMRELDLKSCLADTQIYKERIESGVSEEHARGLLPFDYRQHFVVSFNARSLMHFLDLRGKKDAQLEIQWLSELMFEKFKDWMPEIANWYESERLGKARLSP